MTAEFWVALVVASFVAAAVGFGLFSRAIRKENQGRAKREKERSKRDIPVRRASANTFTQGPNGPRDEADRIDGPGGPA